VIAALVQFARHRRVAARRLAWLAVAGAALSLLLYWYLTPSA
jgi:high-affinity Fe2+/Pb2+ permease